MPSGTLKKTHPIPVTDRKPRTKHHWWQRHTSH